MLRLLVLALLLGNLGYFAWSKNLLAAYGFAPATQSEPQRLATQIQPEAIRLLTAEDAKKLESASATNAPSVASAPECLQAGLFNEQQTALLRASLEATLPPGSWQLESSVESARWIVYMGKFNNPENLAKKRTELRQLGVPFRAVNNEALAPGLALASFPLEADAEKELARIAIKGVRTARVAQERAEARGQILRLATMDAALRAQLDAIRPQLEGKALQPCP